MHGPLRGFPQVTVKLGVIIRTGSGLGAKAGPLDDINIPNKEEDKVIS